MRTKGKKENEGKIDKERKKRRVRVETQGRKKDNVKRRKRINEISLKGKR